VFEQPYIKGLAFMTFEVELKAHLHHPDQVEVEAAKLGVFEKEVFKEDIYFRRKGDASIVPADRYRLRREAGRAVVTFKQSVVAGSVEINEETEFMVDDPHAFFQFADRFGFEPFVVKRKKSRVYRLGQAHVELNEVEHLGHFVEIEILCDERATVMIARTEVARLLNRLGVSAEALEPRNYIELIQAAYPVRYRFINDRNLAWPFEEIQ
jgi:adenylate cyclase class 2